MEEVATNVLATVGHKVYLHKAWALVIPVCEGAYGDLMLEERTGMGSGAAANTLLPPYGTQQPIRRGNAQRQELLSRCLLYTSPSPRDLSTSRMPSSA